MEDMEIGTSELAALREAGDDHVLLDVRTPMEAQICQIEGSVLIPLQQIVQRVGELEPGKRLIVYCHHGVRSLQATSFLRQQGFTDAVSLRGGIEAWSVDVDPSVPRY